MARRKRKVKALPTIWKVSDELWQLIEPSRAGRIGPRPIKLGGRLAWSHRELADWVDAGCPGRVQWDKLRAEAGPAGRLRHVG